MSDWQRGIIKHDAKHDGESEAAVSKPFRSVLNRSAFRSANKTYINQSGNSLTAAAVSAAAQ